MSDQSAIDFEQLGIGELLTRYRLRVPANQRDYAWEAEQVTTLFEDIALAITEDESHYFLGTIVTVPIADGVLEVIDGQQRLATTTLALASMRKRIEKSTPNLARALDTFLTDIDPSTLEPTPKMQLNTADTSVFHSLVSEGRPGPGYFPSRLSHSNLKAAFDEATRNWQAVSQPLNPNDQVKVLQKWMNFIRYNAKVILLKVPSSVNAFKMFETLNDRGLKTSQADLVKNYILGQAGDDLSGAQENWGYVKGALEAIAEDDITVNFLRQSLICQHGYLKESQVYEKVQSSIKGKQSAARFLTEIEILARDYAAIFNFGADKWSIHKPETRRSLEVIDIFDIKPLRPLLLAISRKFNVKETAYAFQGIVSIGIRLLIASSTRSGSVEQPLARAAHQVYQEKITSAKDLFELLSPIIPSDEQFRSRFETSTISNAKFARYILRSLESSHKDEREPWFIPNEDAQSITLEHVLPIKPMDNWGSFSSDDVKLFSKRLGNLVLLQARANSGLGSAPFAEKSKVFSTSPYGTTCMVGDQEEWTPDAISSRQRTLANLAVRAWPHPLS